MAENTEKQPLVESASHRTPFKRTLWIRYAVLLLGICFLLHNYIIESTSPRWLPSNPKVSAPRCPQVEPLVLKSTKELDDMEDYLQSKTFRDKSIERLSGAVQIPTQSYDDLGPVGEDPRWDIFYTFADYLAKTFPLAHSALQVEKVNTHGLLYTWPGTNPKLKPTVLMAHQDVVPVPESTVEQWTYPPFSGFYDGKSIWGRGASDCKNQLTGILEAIEALVGANFAPQRTVILSFGFDEEVGGPRGAQYLAQFLLKRYGHNGVAVIVDEGAVNVESWGRDWAIPGVAEKGAVDVDITVRMPGGHSSIPPQHNGIGVASELISLIEGEYHVDPISETLVNNTSTASQSLRTGT
jgi:Gly-Xaa carboxypeptidase